jgi:cold shock CspA family protein
VENAVRSTGILRSWNEERGFGFIAPTQGGAELFVHVSALPRDGTRPAVGETLSFERGRGKDGRVQAVNVVRTAVGRDARPPLARAQLQPRSRSHKPSVLGQAVVLCLIVAVGVWGYGRFQAVSHRLELERASPPPPPPPPTVPQTVPQTAVPSDAGFRCDGRTHCSQMTSCAEATWFINHCPGTAMDGNHDGVPCEQQWCTSPSAR